MIHVLDALVGPLICEVTGAFPTSLRWWAAAVSYIIISRICLALA